MDDGMPPSRHRVVSQSWERTRTSQMQDVCVRLPALLIDELDLQAKELRVSRSEVVVRRLRGEEIDGG